MANKRPENILVVDDDPSLQRVLRQALEDEGYPVIVAGTGSHGDEYLRENAVDLVLLDLNLPDRNGLEWLRDWKASDTGIATVPVIVITAQNTVENAITAMQAGAFDYVVKPFDLDELYEMVEQALASRISNAETVVTSVDAEDGGIGLVGSSAAMREIYKTIGKTAQTDATTLIQGESGTGKELVAHAIHDFSPRAEKAFVAVNTAAIPADLLEAELFGYEKGAFTGAAQAMPGKFREAAGGTLLLDEIGDMPLALQGKLLRVLQEREITPLGARQNVPVDVRIIAATQVPLEMAVEEGRFRADLYYRLNVVQLLLPPLRERAEDIEPLCRHFLHRMVTASEIPPKTVSKDALSLLQTSHWPGNVRQLENLVRRVALLSPARELDAEAFRRYGGEFEQAPDESAPQSFSAIAEERLRDYVQAMQHAGQSDVWSDVMTTIESVLLNLALEVSHGNQLRAADLLGINRNTIRKKITEHEIDPRQYKKTSSS